MYFVKLACKRGGVTQLVQCVIQGFIWKHTLVDEFLRPIFHMGAKLVENRFFFLLPQMQLLAQLIEVPALGCTHRLWSNLLVKRYQAARPDQRLW